MGPYRRHSPEYVRRWPVVRSRTVIPSDTVKNCHAPACRTASMPSRPANAPVPFAATSQPCPSSGATGSAATSPSIAGCSSASQREKAALTKNSFWLWPGSDLVLRAAQTVRLGGRVKERLRAVGPGQPLERGFEHGFRFGRAYFQKAAFPFDHHRAGIAERCADQSDAAVRVAARIFAHPFGAGTGLAEAASRADQPGPPVPRRGELAGPRPELPEIADLPALDFAQSADFGRSIFLLALKQGSQKVSPRRHRRRRCRYPPGTLRLLRSARALHPDAPSCFPASR